MLVFTPAPRKAPPTLVSPKFQQLEDQLETERQEKDGLWEEVETLKAQAQASQETINNMKRSMEENNSLLRQLLSLNRGHVPPS
jgi:peptidoglycan hydrolase CwlO-like protein